jgi:hypothetical protein
LLIFRLNVGIVDMPFGKTALSHPYRPVAAFVKLSMAFATGAGPKGAA